MLQYLDNIFYISDIWYIFALFGWTGPILLIVNIIMMLDFNEYAQAFNLALLVEDNG